MRRWDLHGLVVEARCEAGVDPAEVLLGLLPEAAGGAAVGLTIETVVVSPATGSAHPERRPAAGRPKSKDERSDGEGGADRGRRPDFSLLGAELRVTPSGFTVASDGAHLTCEGGRIRVHLPAPLDAAGAHRLAQVPLLVAVLAFLRGRGLHHLHAGAVVAPDGRVIVVAGETGSGKSTFTAALAAAGCGYLGDDVVLLAAGPRLLAFPRPFHLSDEAAALILRLRPASRAYAQDERFVPAPRSLKGKLALDPRALFPGLEHRAGPAPAVLLFPCIEDRPDTVLRPLPKAEAFGRLVESSALVAVKALAGTREHLALLGALADGARTLEAALGRDLLEDAAHTAGRVLGEALP